MRGGDSDHDDRQPEVGEVGAVVPALAQNRPRLADHSSDKLRQHRRRHACSQREHDEGRRLTHSARQQGDERDRRPGRRPGQGAIRRSAKTPPRQQRPDCQQRE